VLHTPASCWPAGRTTPCAAPDHGRERQLSQFRSPSFVDDVARVLAITGAPSASSSWS
jgi:hypothetical protein